MTAKAKRGRPKSDDPRRHTYQTFLTDDEAAKLEAVRKRLSLLEDRKISCSEAIRECIDSMHIVTEAALGE